MHFVKEIYIPKSVKSIIFPAFSNCTYLEKFIVDPNNENYSSDDFGVLFNKDKTSLLYYPAGNKRTNYEIPDTVKEICEEAFLKSSHIEKITCGSDLEKICDSAFSYCPSLKWFTFSEKLRTIGDEAFLLCPKLQNIYFPNSLRIIGSAAFAYCMSLTNITLPKNLNLVSDYAFSRCIKLNEISIRSKELDIGTFSLCSSDFKVIKKELTDDFINLYAEYILCCNKNIDYQTPEEDYTIDFRTTQYIEAATIICHSGSTAEAYAKKNGINYETVHFFGDWVYDEKEETRSHTCTICDYSETEKIEKPTEPSTPTKPSVPIICPYATNFLTKLINWFRELIIKIVTFFRSIGDLT